MNTEKIRYSVEESLIASFLTPKGKIPIDKINDISNTDCGFQYSGDVLFEKGDEATLELRFGNDDPNCIDAIVTSKRERDNCLAVGFDKTDNSKYFKSIKKARILFEKRQAKLAESELIELKSEVTLIKNCQVRLFLTCFTLSVALGSLLAYLESYNSVLYVNVIIAISPAYISLLFTAFALQKAMSLNRVVSFIMILKRQIINNHFYSKYRGWEDALNNLYTCDKEECRSPIGSLFFTSIKDIIMLLSNIKKPLYILKTQGQSLLFSSFLFSGYLFIFLTSLSITVFILVASETIMGGLAAIGVTLISFLFTYFVLRFAYKVHVGEYSFVARYNSWKKILNNCEPFNPSNI